MTGTEAITFDSLHQPLFKNESIRKDLSFLFFAMLAAIAEHLIYSR